MNDEIETADLRKSEFLLVNTGCIDLLPNPDNSSVLVTKFCYCMLLSHTYWVLPAFRAASTAAWFSPR
jgi:hypothetical protein